MAAGFNKRALQQHASHLLGFRSLTYSSHVDHTLSFVCSNGGRKFMPVAGKAMVAADAISASQGSHGVRKYYTRKSSQLTVPSSNGDRAFLVDTLALLRRLEAQGLTSKQSEAITAVITEVLNDSLESVSRSFVSQPDMQRTEMQQEAALSKLHAEMKSTQELRFTTLQRETERLRNAVDNMHSELKYEIDKVTAGQRLDLNLEKGRIRDELSNQSAETSDLTNKLDKEINALKTQLEAAKFEVIKYCIGTIVSVTAVGLGLLRILM